MGNPDKDILIIGDGIAGLTLARELSLADRAVTLVGRGQDTGSASWAGGGILSSLVPWHEPAAIAELARLGQQLYPAMAEELQAETAIDIEYLDSDMLVLPPAEAELIQQWAANSGQPCQLLDAAALAATEPALARYEFALQLAGIHQVRSPRLLQALHQFLSRRGVTYCTAKKRPELLLRNGICRGVEIDGAAYQPEQIVIAAGSWSGQLLDGLEPSLPVTPVRGQMLAYDMPADKLQHIVLQQRQYLIPRRDGLILAGSTIEDSGFDVAVTADAGQSLHNMACGLMPELAEKQPLHHWSGLRPATPDGLPYIGQHPAIENLFVNYGHFRNGILLAPASAKLLADIMLERDPALPPAAYSPARQWNG